MPNDYKEILRQQLLAELEERKRRKSYAPQVERLEGGRQERREDLALLGNAMAGFSDAAATIGGTKPGAFIPKTAQRLQSASDLGQKRLDASAKLKDIDPKIYSALGKKPRRARTIEIGDEEGQTTLAQIDDEGQLISDENRPVIKARTHAMRDRDAKPIRDLYNKRMVKIRDTGNAYVRLRALLQDAERSKDPGILDYTIVKAYERFLEPNSVVREGEFKTLAGVGSLIERWDVLMKGVYEGAKLSSTTRSEMNKTMELIYRKTLEAVPRMEAIFRKQAEAKNLNFDRDIKGDLPEISKKPYVKSESQYPKKMYKKIDGILMKRLASDPEKEQSYKKDGWK